MAINLQNINTEIVNNLLKPTQVFYRVLSAIVKSINDAPATLDNAGSPEGVVTARYRDLCWDTINSKLYFKSTATGDTGWVALN